MQAFQTSAGINRKRNFFFVLPVLVLPFILILFAVLGGGGNALSDFYNQKTKGLNLQLPDAHFPAKKEPDKMDLYEARARDSDKLKIALHSDPYRKDSANATHSLKEKGSTLRNIFEQTAERFPGEDLVIQNPSRSSQETAEKEKQLMSRLAQLKGELNTPARAKTEVDASKKEEPAILKTTEPAIYGNTESQPDPEMIQLNTMLDKVMAIQHPESVPGRESHKAEKDQSGVSIVSLAADSVKPGSFGSPAAEDSTNRPEKNPFYEATGDKREAKEMGNAIRAIIPENQTVVTGSTIQLQLLDDIEINGHAIPKGQSIYGTCSMNNERLKIQFSTVRSESSLLAVALEAYDLDGLAGIFIPGSINREAVKQSGDQAVNGLGLVSLDPSIGAQAASAGIQTAKTLLSHRVKLVRVIIKAGYQVLLKASNNKNN